MTKRMTPEQLNEERDVTLLDIRRTEERHEMGWIPGSLHWPEPTVDRIAHIDGPVVLACATGRRSLELAERCADPRVSDLAGGLLGWSVAFPLNRVPGRVLDAESIDPTQFRRKIRSCFVVESVESGSTEEPTDTSALDAVESLFQDVEHLTLHQVWSRIDQLAHLARRGGHRVDYITKHVEEFYGLSLLLRGVNP